ncbi:Hypothetical predicted protein [Paramuricea clavata]|uniref:Uncharacterized protein n=1 Tax=Paramuricea clavata TaxID=317549 RepID=A0A7D9IR10_PARCT|nr:Hypothetical predicted protein [Paramuricea clavata]
MIWTCVLSLLVLTSGAGRTVGYQPQDEVLLKQQPYEISNAAMGQGIIRLPREIDESVEEAQAKLFNVDRAADAVTGIERGVKADPMYIEDDTPDVRLAKEKDFETRRSAIAVENIEKAIGLDEKTIESLIDDVKQVSQRQANQYENAILKDRKEEEEAKGERKVETEDKLLRDEELEGKAKETVDQINRLEKVMTVVEVAKFDAERRAGQQLQAAEAWKDRMNGRAKKSKIMKVPEKNSVKKTARHILENIIKKEKYRKNANKGSKRNGTQSHKSPIHSVLDKNTKDYRSKRSFSSDSDTKDLLRIKFKKIGKLANEILKNIQK